MTDPTILVAGLGRCGSSLVMQMLAAAGVPTVGAFPSFEINDELELRLNPVAWRSLVSGKAVKVLDAQRVLPPAEHLDRRMILLTRHPGEQAKSALKLIGARRDRQAKRAMEAGMRRDTRTVSAAMGRIGRFLNLPFENIIHDPRGAAEAIARELQPYPRPLDVDAMARCVRRRPATCLPYLLELELLHG